MQAKKPETSSAEKRLTFFCESCETQDSSGIPAGFPWEGSQFHYLSWDWENHGIFVRVGWDRHENPNLCHQLVCAIFRIFSPLYFAVRQPFSDQNPPLHKTNSALFKPAKLHRQNQSFYLTEHRSCWSTAALIF